MPGDVETKQGEDRWRSLRGIPPDAKGLENPSSPPMDNPSYYDISLLKPPLWTPEVGAYFFLGGLSAGAFVLARLAERFGGASYRALTRKGTAIAALAVLPCAPLLIKDLGDPKRFHHMLRVWKPGSPMNLGSWTLTGYTALSVLAEVREWSRVRRKDVPPAVAGRVLDTLTGAATDAAGMPLALLLAGYTGVLLSTTATPLWCKNSWLGTLFSASAVGTGASAVRLALEAEGEDTPSSEALSKVETAARAAEVVSHIGFLATAGPLAKPLLQGPLAAEYWVGAVGAGLVLPTVLEHLPASPKARRWLKIAAGLSALAGGYALRSVMVAAGRPSASDPDAARAVSGS